MSRYKVIKRAFLKDRTKPTGKTKHYSDQNQLPMPFSLEIVQYYDDDGYYLFYIDINGQVQTDTYHDSLQGAISQAEWEFELTDDAWVETI
jgi:hypothetical protein